VFETVAINYKEPAKNLIDQIPESKMCYIVAYFQETAVPEEIPNAETIASIEELESGGGTLFTGNTDALFTKFKIAQILPARAYGKQQGYFLL